MTTTPHVPCAAPARICGTPSGWRSGGHCPRCRAAHNAETNRYRGLRPDDRKTVLSLLRAGHTPQDAAAAVGKTAATLSGTAARDSELRMALDGQPEEYQFVARVGDYLAALTRNGGNKTQAAASLGIHPWTLQNWRERSPALATAEDAVLALITNVTGGGIHSRRKVPDAVIDYAVALLEKGATLKKAAAEAGISVTTLYNRAHDHERLRTALNRNPIPISDKEDELRSLWLRTDLTNADIAKHLGVSRATINTWKQELGLPPRVVHRKTRKTKLTPELEATLRSLWADPHMTSPKIAEQLGGVHAVTVHKWARRLNLPSRRDIRRATQESPDGASSQAPKSKEE